MMIKNLLFVIAALLLAIPSYGATIELNDGSVIRGKIIRMDKNNVVVRSKNLGRVKLQRSRVKSITDGDADSNGANSRGINININNNLNQDNNQNNEQNVEQNVTQVNNNQGGKKNERQWQQGFYSRFGLGSGDGNIKLTTEHCDS